MQGSQSYRHQGSYNHELAKEYEESLRELTFNSKLIINNLTIIADENIKHAREIVDVVWRRMLQSPPNAKLPVIYLMDSILKNVGGVYLDMFAKNLFYNVTSTFDKVDSQTRNLITSLVETWKQSRLFAPNLITRIEVRMHNVLKSGYNQQGYGNQPPPVHNRGSVTTGSTDSQNLYHLETQILQRLAVLMGKHNVNFLQMSNQARQQERTALLLQVQSELGTAANPNQEVVILLQQLQQLYLHINQSPPQQPQNIPPPQPHLHNQNNGAMPNLVPNYREHNPSMTNSHGNARAGRQVRRDAPTGMGGPKNGSGLANANLTGLLKTLKSMGKSSSGKSQGGSTSQHTNPRGRQQDNWNRRATMPKLSFRDLSSLKRKSVAVINSLYSDFKCQCTQCGMRFRKAEELKPHVQWHFEINYRKRNIRISRVWFQQKNQWIRPTQALIEHKSKQEEKKKAEEAKIGPKSRVPAPKDGSTPVCALCMDSLEKPEWDSDLEEWMCDDAVMVDGKYYHSSCHTALQNQSPQIPRKSVSHIKKEVQIKPEPASTSEGGTKRPQLESSIAPPAKKPRLETPKA
mmetsp:Transcript_8972/g.9956  ORF Transcript_8972/g.9956 Transcript_8972/m.9956 type:complete len:574 (+) Transcript_8972:326-2047(+)